MATDRADNAPPNRRREVLEAALELLSEQGYAGASLRKLAAKVGIAQPSLYHYFRTKEELVEAVLATFAGDMFSAMDPRRFPKRLIDVPRFVVDTALAVYERPTHPEFVRVAFAVSRVKPRFGQLMRKIFVDQATIGIAFIVKPFVDAGQIGADEAVDFVRLLINAMGLRLMEEAVLFDPREPGPEVARYAELVVDVGETWVRARAR